MTARQSLDQFAQVIDRAEPPPFHILQADYPLGSLVHGTVDIEAASAAGPPAIRNFWGVAGFLERYGSCPHRRWELTDRPLQVGVLSGSRWGYSVPGCPKDITWLDFRAKLTRARLAEFLFGGYPDRLRSLCRLLPC